MTPRTSQQKTEDEFIAVKKQALVDKHDVLVAIDTRMSKLGADHDLLITINSKIDTLITTSGDHESRIRMVEKCTGDLNTHVKDIDDDIAIAKRNTNLWGGGNLVAMLGAFVAAYFHK